MNAGELIDRVFQIQETRGLKDQDAEFARETGIDYQTFKSLVKRHAVPSTHIIGRLLITYPNLSAEWLFRGIGDMFYPEPIEDGDDCGCVKCNRPIITADISRQPDLDVISEYNNGDLKLGQTPCVKQFGDYTCGWVVPNNAMAPEFCMGDKVALKLQETKDIINGNAYVLDTRRGMFLRYIYEEENDKLRCKSTGDPRYTDIIIDKDEVYSVFVIMGMLRQFC